jgi:Ca-activated chloride channel family protein
VLSDGEDTSSLVSFEEVLELAKRSETAIYTIGLQPREASALKGFREAEFVLRQLAQETGGRAFFAKQIDELKDVYGQIADELSSQYSMGYASKNPAPRRRLPPHRRAGARPNTTAAPSAVTTGPFRTEQPPQSVYSPCVHGLSDRRRPGAPDLITSAATAACRRPTW